MLVGVISQDSVNVSLMQETLARFNLGLELIPWGTLPVGFENVVIDLSSSDLEDEWVQGVLLGAQRLVFSEKPLVGMSYLERGAWASRLISGLSAEEEGAPDCTQSSSPNSQDALPVWILGASTGGPTSVQAFLDSLQEKVNCAFVLVQHITAEYLNVLRDILQGRDGLQVNLISDGMDLEPRHLYICPPDTVPSVEDGKFKLRQARNTPFSPSIDEALTSLSEAQGIQTNAIIFTGMGNDGTAGLQSVAQHGGKVWCQSPDTCAVSTMPQAAINTGLVEIIGTPAELAQGVCAR